METSVTALYGLTGSFFTTNERYTPPFPDEEDYAPPQMSDSDDDMSDAVDEENEAAKSEEEKASDLADQEERRVIRKAKRVALRRANEKLMVKLRELAFEGRRKEIAQITKDQRLIFPMMWVRMSAASQSKVREDVLFKEAKQNLDCISLWDIIRRSHLTHTFGIGDPMRELNVSEQESRYANLKQGEREYVSTFKQRFDYQVQANEGVGIAEITESKRALDFINKLDPKRYRGMHSQMRNLAVRGRPDAYPATLAEAYRTASGWTNEESGAGIQHENNSTFLADTCFVTKAKDPEKGSDKPGGSKTKKKGQSEVTCYVCGKIGHYSRECEKRKLPEKTLALLTLKSTGESDEEDEDEWEAPVLVTTNLHELCCFANNEFLLDSESSLNVFNTKTALRNMRPARNSVLMKGVQLGSDGVMISEEGDFLDIGTVFYSKDATANILSFASQVDAGADIKYDSAKDLFTLRPSNSGNTYTFKRREVSGSGGRLYSCKLVGMDKSNYTSDVVDRVHVSTVEDNMQRFTKREVSQAWKARELLGRMGFPSVARAIQMVETGANFDVTARDFQIADSIWGKDVTSIKGKTKKRASPVADISVGPAIVQQQQVLAIDVMFIDKIPVLIGLASPLGLTIATSLVSLDLQKSSRSAAVIMKGISYFLGVLSSRNFLTPLLMSDGEGAIGKLQSELNTLGIEVDISGAGGHVARIERKIQVIKERVRAHIHLLPFTLNNMGVIMCILYCVSRLNFEPSETRTWGACPREAFLGRKLDGRRDFRCAFGDYVLATVPMTNNTMSARAEEYVVMLPLGNRTGSVKMMSPTTGRMVSRDQFKIIPMPASVIAAMNELAKKDGRSIHMRHITQYEPLNQTDLPDYITVTPHVGNDPSIALREQGAAEAIIGNLADEAGMDTPLDNPDRYDAGGGGMSPQSPQTDFSARNDPLFASQEIDPEYPEQPPHIDTPPNQSDSAEIRGDVENGGEGEIGVGDDNETPAESEINGDTVGDTGDTGDSNSIADSYGEQGESNEAPVMNNRRDLLEFFRRGKGHVALVASQKADPSVEQYYSLNITVKEALRTRGSEARRVILKELKQMIDKKVWKAVDRRSMTAAAGRAVIRSSMFLKEKFLPSGEFEKLKARLVAGGDQQDKDLYDDLSAPTVSTCSVFTVLTIAAHEGRKAAVVDIGGAFLNAEMTTGIDVHMRLDRTISDMMVELDPQYEGYRDSKGCVIVQLDRALYGCVESAALWYENLRTTMTGLGYERNSYDNCVFNKTDNGVQCTATVHVDDLFITSTSVDMIESLSEGLRKRYGEISKTSGTVLNYLGMVFDLSHPGEARVTMRGYVEELLLSTGVTGGARTPATDGLFEQRADAQPVSDAEQKRFHRAVARLLYLAKRARPDTLTTVAYLATRVTRCTTHDVEKLGRLLRYVNHTKERGVILRIGKLGVHVSVYIDAAYGVHHDKKSHTGSAVVVGEVGAVHCKSAKQQIVTKSSTEAELVALSDSANQGLHLRMFLIGQGHEVGPVTVYQDNLSCMAMIDRGRHGAERTRHIDLRYYWLKERVDKGEAIVKHLGTKSMYANMLTKPLQGAQFIEERRALTGWD